MSYPTPRPSKHRLKVKRGSSGFGLFTESPIKRGAFVIEYWGPLISDAQAEKKGGKYLFDIQDSNWTIDGSIRANVARYINHSCKPNCEVVLHGRRMFIFARRAIAPGEELTYDYGKEYFDEYIGSVCRCGNHPPRRSRKRV